MARRWAGYCAWNGLTSEQNRKLGAFRTSRAVATSSMIAYMALTVVPLHNLDLPVGSHIPFASGFVLQDVPDWVKKEGFLDYLAYRALGER